MKLARMFGKRQEAFKTIMKGLNGIAKKYGDVSYEFQFLKGLRLCFVLWAGDEEFPSSAQILFPIIFQSLMQQKMLPILEIWYWII